MSQNLSLRFTVGFQSSALGAPYLYPAKTNGQLNLLLTAVAGGKLWCRAAAGTGAWQLGAHTAAQAQAVVADFVKMRDQEREKP